MLKTVQIKIASELTIDTAEQIEIERCGNALGVIIGREENGEGIS